VVNSRLDRRRFLDFLLYRRKQEQTTTTFSNNRFHCFSDTPPTTDRATNYFWLLSTTGRGACTFISSELAIVLLDSQLAVPSLPLIVVQQFVQYTWRFGTVFPIGTGLGRLVRTGPMLTIVALFTSFPTYLESVSPAWASSRPPLQATRPLVTELFHTSAQRCGVSFRNC